MKRFVIIDVETTGVSYAKGDRIIQLAFVVVENTAMTNRYMTYLNPGREIPPFIQSLTCIEATHVETAPSFSEVAPDLLEVLDGAYFVAHNADFDLQFINAELTGAGYPPFQGPVLDTVELARISFPTADSFRLSQLTKQLDMNHQQPHRADSDAEAAAQLLLQIFHRFASLPKLTLQQIDKLAGQLKSDVSSLLHEWLENHPDEADPLLEEYGGLVLRRPADDESVTEEKSIPSFEEFYTTCMKNEQWCKERIGEYENRPGQLEMISFIHEVFNDRSFGLIEAGTGTGKTLAYLVPAAFQAKEHNCPVVISTHTVQLQEQLVKQELPILNSLLPFSFRSAVLKGRNHYLCLRKFSSALHNQSWNESYDKTLSKAQILVWLTATETGDVEELSLASHSSHFWNELASDSFSCNSPKCQWFARCFYQRAKRKAKKANLIITNHSLVLSDVMTDHQVIPKYRYAIIDEAHHFEETASEQLGQQLDYHSLLHFINELGSCDGEGLLAKWLVTMPELDSHLLTEAEDCGRNLKQDWYELFALLHQHAEKNADNYNERGRTVTTIDFHGDDWVIINDAVDRCSFYLQDWIDSIGKLKDAMKEESSEKGMIAFFVERVQTVADTFADLLKHPVPGRIHWLEVDTKGPRQAVYVQSKPVDVSELLADEFFHGKDSVVLTSATLAVNQQFQYIIQRLGLEDVPVKTKIVDSPFQWENQVRLMVPTDMPMIQKGENAYIEAAVMHIHRVAMLTKGKMLVLFTSYEMLKRSYQLLKELLADDYMLIAQGVQTGSRTKLTKNFQQFDKAILLGTSSFWEGVDIPGNDLSVIAIVRLPFSPPNDPLFQAKSNRLKEEGASPFMKLALPQAILRFKQGFGRLIRRSTDKGIVIVLDRRIVAAKYGKSFLHSLPAVPVIEKSLDELEIDISNWL
ncbi:ATP-dependent DNA helicase DinG [Evansella caseinilytica]|uniref:3'-5' exonuclease DinG n=1 Tax=Evansella caseinilytica TaxID=1503961 RepID=A0A1H3NHT7_9BACI|nr:ATP-dependent DNA helicase DinG [Evansella caseinilytica]SDY88313.1 ATP-dependent DNA helicase DinG [Evansella caseinilytica]